MPPRRPLVVLLALALPAAAIGVACTFPGVTFAPTDASTGVDSALPPDVDPDGKGQDATVVPEGGGRIDASPDASGCAKGGCDCDEDNAKNNGQGCNPPEGGVDCDDFNAFIHPGQGFVSSPWDTQSPHTPVGDWNCDGTTTKQYPYGVGACSGLTCPKPEGFIGNPACGVEGDYVVCQGGALGAICSEASREKRTQGCR